MKASAWDFYAELSGKTPAATSPFRTLTSLGASLTYVVSNPFQYFRRYLTLLDADRRARRCPAEFTRALPVLSSYLTRNFPELLAVRAIYTWIAENIEYDWESYRNMERCKPQDAATVLKNRLGVCAGFSRLFVSLMTQASVHSFYLTGVVKDGVGDKPQPHAWSGARVDGTYHLFDVTWGATHRERYFMASPKVMRKTHFPEDRSWQLMKPHIELDEFKRI